MKLKDLTVGLSRNDNTQTRSVNIGPLNDGLNFIYGERGAGKTTIRTLVSELLLDSCEPNMAQRTAAICNSIGVANPSTAQFNSTANSPTAFHSSRFKTPGHTGNNFTQRYRIASVFLSVLTPRWRTPTRHDCGNSESICKIRSIQRIANWLSSVRNAWPLNRNRLTTTAKPTHRTSIIKSAC